MKLRKVFTSTLAVLLLTQVVGPAVGPTNYKAYNTAYASNTSTQSIYDLYEFSTGLNDETLYPDNSFFYNGKAYREDVMKVKQDKNFRKEALEALKEKRRWAFESIKQYRFNSNTEKVEYKTIGEWIKLYDKTGKSYETLKEEFTQNIKWSSENEILALQDAYRKYTLDSKEYNLDIGRYLDYYLTSQENNKTIVDRYNDYQQYYVKEALEEFYSKPRGRGDDGIWESPYLFNFGDSSFIGLLSEEANVAMGKVSAGDKSYISMHITNWGAGDDKEKEIVGDYKFHIGQATDDKNSYEVSGSYENSIDEYYPDSTTNKGFAYREDLLYVDQSLDLQKSVEGAIRNARQKVFDEGVTVGGVNIRNTYKTKALSKDLYSSPEVYDGMAHSPMLDRAYENYVSIKIGKPYYMHENKSPNGLYSYVSNFGDGNIVRYSTDKNLTGEDFINHILYDEHSDGKSAYELIKEESKDPSLAEAKLLLSNDIQSYYITRIYGDDIVLYQLNYEFKYALHDYKDRNMTGYKGTYKFKMGTKGVDQQEVVNEKKVLAKQVYDSVIQNNAAKILINKSPKTIANIKRDLEALVASNEELIEEAMAMFGNDPVEMMRYKFDKKIATHEQRELAKSMYDNIARSESAKILLSKTPKTVKAIEKDLRNNVNTSASLVEETLKILE